MPYYIILALCAFTLTLIGTRLSIVMLRKRAQPASIALLRGRKKPPVPTGGGIVVTFSLVICLLSADISYGLILSLLLLAAIGMLHSMIEIAKPIRIIVQIMAVAIGLSAMQHGLFHNYALPLTDKILTGMLWVWFINIYISTDKTDGLCSIEAISIAAGLCLIAVFSGSFPSTLSAYSLILAAAVIGFSWWNWPPAKIHMGEAGTVPISFLLGYLLLLAANSGHYYTVLILPAYMFAASLAAGFMCVFLRKHQTTCHYTQKALDHGRTHNSIIRYIIGVNILLVFLSLRCITDPENAIPYIATAYACVFILLGFFAHNKDNKHDSK